MNQQTQFTTTWHYYTTGGDSFFHSKNQIYDRSDKIQYISYQYMCGPYACNAETKTNVRGTWHFFDVTMNSIVCIHESSVIALSICSLYAQLFIGRNYLLLYNQTQRHRWRQLKQFAHTHTKADFLVTWIYRFHNFTVVLRNIHVEAKDVYCVMMIADRMSLHSEATNRSQIRWCQLS